MAIQLAEGTETAHTLPIPPEMFGVIALVVFASLLAVTLAFRNLSNRH